MSFAVDNGYTPKTFEEIMDFIRLGVNDQFGTSYTAEDFIGTGYYKYAYVFAQKVQEQETKTSEIFQKFQEYIRLTNERIARSSTTYPGAIEAFLEPTELKPEGYLISIKQPAEADAGKVFICVDLDEDDDDFDDQKAEVFELIRDNFVAGMVFMGSETEDLTLTNGQSFTFKFQLPNRIPVLLRLTAVISENNMQSVNTDQEIREAIFANIAARYRLGLNFEPQRYYTLSDAPWAGSILLEWSDDAGSNYYDDVFEADYDDLFEIALEDIEVNIT